MSQEHPGQTSQSSELLLELFFLLQVLLDAAVMEMQQYSSVVARVNVTPQPQPQPQPAAPSSAPAAQAANTTTGAATEAEADTTTASGSSSSDKEPVETGETGERFPEPCQASTTTETSETSAKTPVVTSSPGVEIFEIFVVVCFLTKIFPVLRPPAETGTRPKTSVVSPAPAENTNTGNVLTDDQVAANTGKLHHILIFLFQRRKFVNEDWLFLKNKRRDL